MKKISAILMLSFGPSRFFIQILMGTGSLVHEIRFSYGNEAGYKVYFSQSKLRFP